jgi:hypothetical protein
MLDILSERLLVMSVLKFSPVPDLGNLACCSKHMRCAADNQSLWRRRYVESRKKLFKIGPNSVHQPYRDVLDCRFTPRFTTPFPSLINMHGLAQRAAARAQWTDARRQWRAGLDPAFKRWVAAGRPCTNVHHYDHGTLLEVGRRATNYRNFKRAYAKTVKSKLRVHTPNSKQILTRARDALRFARERLELLEEDNECRCQPNAHRKFDAMLALPPGTPPHLRTRMRKKTRKTKK